MLNGNYYHLPLPPLAVPLTITTVDSESRCTPIIPGKAAPSPHCRLGTHLIIKAREQQPCRGDWKVPYSLGSALLPICLLERHWSTVPQKRLATNICLTTHTRFQGCLRFSCWVVTAAALPSKALRYLNNSKTSSDSRLGFHNTCMDGKHAAAVLTTLPADSVLMVGFLRLVA